MEWLTEYTAKHADIYEGEDSWTRVMFSYDGHTYYHINGKDESGNNFEIIIESITKFDSRELLIYVLNKFSTHSDIKQFSEYFTHPSKRKLTMTLMAATQFEPDRLKEIRKAFDIIMSYSIESDRFDFEIIKNIELKRDKHNVKCIFCNEPVDIYRYYYYLKTRFIVDLETGSCFPCFNCACACDDPKGTLMKCVSCPKYMCEGCFVGNDTCRDCCDALTDSPDPYISSHVAKDQSNDDDQCDIFVIIRKHLGMGDKVQTVLDEMEIESFGFDFVGSSSMYLGKEHQFTGPTETVDAYEKYLREYLDGKYKDSSNGIVDYWICKGEFPKQLWKLENQLRKMNRKYGKEISHYSKMSSIEKKMKIPIL
jgi:hypothetical protein